MSLPSPPAPSYPLTPADSARTPLPTAHPLQWTEADVWTVAVNLPKGAHVAYKFITLGPRHRFTGYVEEEHDPGSSNLKVGGEGKGARGHGPTWRW
jgi:hypothetical protein